MKAFHLYDCIPVPQKDGSDTRFFLDSLENQPASLTIKNGPTVSDITLFDGKVAVRYDRVMRNHENAPADHINIRKAIDLLKTWPEIYMQFGEIIREFQPVYLPGSVSSGFLGSMSHQPSDTFGSMWATVNDYICLSQAFVHEMAHNKLFALGQQFENPFPLFLNAETELYDSPIRLDIPRPMAAVFHGVYAFVHVLTLDLKILESRVLDEEATRYLTGLLHKNVNRVRIGLQIVVKCAKPSEEGRRFVENTISWAESEIQKTEQYLNKIDTGQTFLIIGPAGSGKTSFSAALSKKLNKEYISMDLFSWDFWYQTPVLQQLFLNLFGESKRFLLNQTLSLEQKRALIRELIIKKLVNANVMDYLKLSLITHTARKFKNAIIDTGGGHCILLDTANINKLKQFLTENKIVVIQVKPVGSIDYTLHILRQRIGDRPYGDEELVTIQNNMHNPSYRSLCNYVIDSEEPIDQCVNNFEAFLKERLHETVI